MTFSFINKADGITIQRRFLEELRYNYKEKNVEFF